MKNIAIFIGQIYLDTQRKVITSIYEECKKYNYNLTVYSFFSSKEDTFNEGEFELYNRINWEKFDGFILYSETLYSEKIREKLIDRIVESNRKFVSIDNPVEHAVNVTSDNVTSMKKIAELLFDQNDIKYINYITGPVNSNDSNSRIDAFKKVAESRGITFDPDRVYVGDFFSESGNDAITYFRNNNLLDADVYVCANDQMALGAYYGLAELGINVPEECMITGFDNIIQSRYNNVPITSVERNEKEIGRIAFLKLLEILKGRNPDDRLVESTLVLRESTNTPYDTVDATSKEKFINAYMKSNFKEYKCASLLNESNTEFMNARTIDELTDVLAKYLEKLEVKEFYLGLDDGLHSDDINIALTYKNGEFIKNQVVSREEVLGLIQGDKGGNLCIASPLHYADRYYGYVVTKNTSLPLEYGYFNSLTINLSNMLRAIESYNRMNEMIKELRDVSIYDQLTHLYNRTGFFDLADPIFDEYKFKDANMFILFIDLDGLKTVNDNLGHKYGDMFIKDFAEILKDPDISENNITMRFGGDEFVIFGYNKTKDEIDMLIESIKDKIEKVNSEKNAEYAPYSLGASIGYHSVTPYDISLLSVIDKADKDMYAIKLEKKTR